MTQEAVCIETPTIFLRRTIADASATPIGTIMKLSGDNLVENSGADKPFVYLVDPLLNSNELILDIVDDNPTDNIGILCESIVCVDEHTKYLEKEEYEVSSYHSGYKDVPDELHNIIVTTFKSAKGIEFDIVIMPYFQDASEKVNTEYFVGVTRAKTQVFMICIGSMPEVLSDFDEDSYRLIDKRKDRGDI